MAAATDVVLANSSAPMPPGQVRTALPAVGGSAGTPAPTTGQLWPRVNQK